MNNVAAKRGQIFVVLAFLLAGLCLLLALNLDIFIALRGKVRAQNAADAAALAAARWQGKTLNLLGELNLAHLEAVAESNMTAAAGISAMQERLAFAGPVMGMIAANRAARENGAGEDAEMAQIVRTVRIMAGRLAPTAGWPNKSADYQAMLEAVIADGVYAGCENAAIISVAPGAAAMMLQKGFYDALSGPNFPWFCRYLCHVRQPWSHGETIGWLLSGEEETLSGISLGSGQYNSEFFGVSALPCRGYLRALGPRRLQRLLDESVVSHGLKRLDAGQIMRNAGADTNLWFVYDIAGNHGWRAWHELKINAAAHFPLLREVREEYDVFGSVAACRVKASHATLASGGETNHYTIAAAAKAFGALSSSRRVTDLFAAAAFDEPFPDNCTAILPSFSFVRLIPLGGANEGNLNNADYEFLTHANYLAGSPLPDLEHDKDTCRYCLLLQRWTRGFREQAAKYLSDHAHDEVCAPPGSGSVHGGGSHFAH